MIEGPANRRANAGGEPTRRWLHRWRTTAGLGVALLVSGTAAAQFIDESYFEDLDEFANLTVEDLLDFRLDVTSVAGTRQSWFTTPAGMTLLTPEAIRRGGHRSVAEALRLVPGVQVAQTNASTWSVSSRGDTRFANKMLVMIDGRATYDLLFSGTFWDVQDPLLEDLDRIEVVRGPGATLWGANAVNGVVSIVTKSARETQGLLVKGGIGTQDEASGAIRYGLTLGDDAWMRVWGKYRHHGGFERGADDWDLGHGGLRLDVQPEDDLAWTIEAEAYETGRIGEIVVRPTPLGHLTTDTVRRDGRAAGGHVRGRVTRDGANGWSLQSYYDHTTRVIADGFEVDRDTFDLDFRRRHTGSGHDLHWGLGLRHTRDETEATPVLSFDPSDRSLTTLSAFVQDTITLVPDHLFAMFGTKVEDNDITGFEVQPGVRLWWTPDDRRTAWAAVSRPVRVPSRTEEDVRLIAAYVDPDQLLGGPPSGSLVPALITGDRRLVSEELMSYEVGQRVMLDDGMTLVLVGYYHDYDDLVSVSLTDFMLRNSATADVWGLESVLRHDLTDAWNVDIGYSFTEVNFTDPLEDLSRSDGGHHHAHLSTTYAPSPEWELHGGLYYADRVRSLDADASLRLDLGATWRPHPGVELSIWGRNLLDPAHREGPNTASTTEVERGIFLQATIRF